MTHAISALLMLSAALFATSSLASTLSVKPSDDCPGASEGDVLRLTLKVPHGSDLAVINPDGNWLFIALGGEPLAGVISTPIDGDQFTQMATVEIRKSDKGLIQRDATTTEEVLFGSAGDYHVIVGTALDSETPDYDAYCDVQFTP